jgi:hypothetical protein
MSKFIKQNLQFFAISSALFSYQILVSTYMSSSLASLSISILIAPTYLAFAFAVGISFMLERFESRFASALSLITMLCLAASILLLNKIIENLNADILQMGKESSGAFSHIEGYIISLYSQYVLKIATVIGLPFFFYGLYFSSLLKNGSDSTTLKIISVELVGAIVGITLSLILLNYLGWKFTFLFFFLSALLTSLVLYGIQKQFRLVACGTVLLVSSLILSDKLKPISNSHISVRDFQSLQQVELLRESWNSFSKVQTVRAGPNRKYISIGDGTGRARMPQLYDTNLSLTTEITNYFKPQNVLILFAGAGHELVKFREQKKHRPTEVTGIEINSHVIAHGLLDPDGALKEILKDKNYKLIHSDARQYLEKDQAKYDAILFSFSGASVAYYSGAIMHTTQYVFTREALRAALDKLTPQGHLIIFGASKMNIISNLKALQIPDLKNKTILLEPQSDRAWQRSWDSHILILSNSNNKLIHDLKQLTDLANYFDYTPVVHPQLQTSPNHLPFEKLLVSDDWQKSLVEINESSHLRFTPHTDDKPFVYRIKPNFSLLQIKDQLRKVFQFKFSYTTVDLIFLIFGFSFLALGYTICKNLIYKQAAITSYSIFLSFCFGIFSTGLQFFVIYKSVLFLGFPNFALGLGVISSLCSSLICFTVLQKVKITKFNLLSIQCLGFALLISFIAILQRAPVIELIFQLPLVFQIFLLLLIFVAIIVLNSFFYPYLLSLQPLNLKLSKQIIVFDVLGCSLGSLLLPLLMEDHGISQTLLWSVLFLFLIVLLGFFIEFKKESPLNSILKA